MRFTRTFLAWFLVPLLAIGLFNLAVDPLALLSSSGIPGLSQHKPMLRDHERLFKPLAVARLRPQAVILGSSRSNHALDPTHHGWGGLSVYNLSVTGTNIREMRQMLEHAIAVGSPRLAVIELDSAFFEVPANADRLASLAAPGRARPLAAISTVAGTALTADTLRLSIATLRGQALPDEYTDLGRQTEAVFRWRIDRYGGLWNTFEGYMREIGPYDPRRAAAWRAAGAADAGPDFPGMDELRRILALGREHGVRLLLYVSPAHAITRESERLIYGWPLLEAWKWAVVAAVEAEQGRGAAPPQLWDFSGYNSVTTEAIPPPGSPLLMRYYWDSSHYRGGVGGWVLDRLLGEETIGASGPPDFGVRLTAASLEGLLADTRAGAARYEAGHPAETAFVRALSE